MVSLLAAYLANLLIAEPETQRLHSIISPFDRCCRNLDHICFTTDKQTDLVDILT